MFITSTAQDNPKIAFIYPNFMYLILYSKIGCHLCEGLKEKLEQITALDIQLEVREITTNPDWFDRYQYEIPILCLQVDGIEQPIPRFSPRASVAHVQQILQQLKNNPNTSLPPSL